MKTLNRNKKSCKRRRVLGQMTEGSRPKYKRAEERTDIFIHANLTMSSVYLYY